MGSFLILFIVVVLIALFAATADRYLMRTRLEAFRNEAKLLWASFNTPGAKGLTQEANTLACNLFDTIYGKEILELRRLGASIVSTIISFFVIFSLVIYFREGQVNWNGSALAAIVFGLIFNVLPDYFSISETRWILNKSRGSGASGISFYLLLDVLLTAVVFILFISILYLYGIILESLGLSDANITNQNPMELLKTATGLSESKLNDALIYASILTTFFTSFFWILFAFLFSLIRFLKLVFPVTHFLYEAVIESETPILAIAGFINSILIVGWLISMGIGLLF